MGSYGGHILPGTFFLIFGIWYAIRYSVAYLRTKSKNEVFYCCKGKIPFSVPVIEGVTKIVMICIGILVELYYPGAPMGQIHNSEGKFTGPMNWQHATMYFFFGISGLADVISYSARHVVPPGLDRFFGGLALFIEGYLFFFHLHGRSLVDIRVHVLLVLMVWPSSVVAILETFFINNRKTLHILEMFRSVTVFAQGLWFWQVAYILYPPNGMPWYPCGSSEMHHMMKRHGDEDHQEQVVVEQCLGDEHTILNFITLFWSWHLALAIFMIGTVYLFVYKLLKQTGKLDKRFTKGYDTLLPSNGHITSSSIRDERSRMISDDLDDDDEL